MTLSKGVLNQSSMLRLIRSLAKKNRGEGGGMVKGAKKRRTSRMTKAAMKRGPFLLDVSMVLACFLAFRDKEIEVILRGDPDVQKDRSARSERLCLFPGSCQLR